MRLLFPVVIALAVFSYGCSDKGNDPQPCHPEELISWDYDPSWASDGSGFVFAGEDTLNVEVKDGVYSGEFRERVYFFDIADSSLSVLLEGPLSYSPKLSPDGNWLVFESGADIHIMNMETHSIEQLTFLGKCFFPDWSPDGTEIAYDVSRGDDRGVYILDIESCSSRRLKSDCRQPVWLPDGVHLLVVDFSAQGDGEIAIIDTLGAEFAQLTDDGDKHAFKRAIDVSPNGLQVCFVQQFECEMPQLWIMDIDGTGKNRLTSRGAGSCSISPDGNWILYTYRGDNNGRIWAVRSDGSEKRQLTHGRPW